MPDQRLLARIKDTNLRKACEKVFEVAEGFRARGAAINADRRMSDLGRTEAITAQFEKDFAPSFRLARQPVRDARVSLASRKAKVAALPAPDGDAVVNQLAAMEIRAHIASLALEERTRLIFDPGTDRRIIDAALAAPPELSGVPRDRHAALLQRRLQELYPADLAAIEEDERSLLEVESAIEVATREMKMTLDPNSDGRRFDSLVNRAAVPWIIDQGNGHVVCVKIDADGNASYPPATDIERRTGRTFASVDAYRTQAA